MSTQSLVPAARDALKHLREARVVGLGSGSSVAELVRAMKILDRKDFTCVTTSLQIKIEAERSGLNLGDESLIPKLDIVFDGADQIDSDLNMIKGGGGALLREKILISASKQVVIIASASKFSRSLNRPVPIEIHPMARLLVSDRLKAIGGTPSLRMLEKGYPFVTENGNLILDTSIGEISEPARTEVQLKSIPGVLEAGIFTRRPDSCYKVSENGEFEELH